MSLGITLGGWPLTRETLVKRRVWLNTRNKQLTAAINAVPILCRKCWADSWRRRHQAGYRSELRVNRLELAMIARKIGPPPALWKPRGGASRIRRSRAVARPQPNTSDRFQEAVAHLRSVA